MKRTTLTEIAEKAGVSIATVSRVFNRKELQKVSPETQQLVRSLIEESGFMPDINARRLVSGKSFLAGFQVPSVRSPIVNSAALEALTLRAAADGYGILCGLARNRNDTESVEHMLALGADGIVWQPGGVPSGVLLKRICRLGTKIVWFNKDVNHDFPQVRNDEKETGRMAARYFLKNGMTRFALAGEQDSHTALRLAGMNEMLASAGLPETVYCRISPGQPLSAAIISQLRPGTGLFCCNHGIGLKAEAERLKLGLAECRIAAYGDAELAEMYRSGITLTAPDSVRLGICAFEVLKKLIDGVRLPDVNIPPELIEGKNL